MHAMIRFIIPLLLTFNLSAYANYTTPAQSFQSANQTLLYHPAGDGQHTILLLGGGPGFSSWNLSPIQQHLATDYRVLLMDMRGIGENKNQPVEDGLINRWIEDIDALRKQENAGQLILIGHSWGALMAQLYARQYPNRIARLILINPVDPAMSAMEPLVRRIDDRRQQAGLLVERDEWDWPQTQDIEQLTRQQLAQVLPTYFYELAQGKDYAKQFDTSDFEMTINHQAWAEYQTQPIHAEDLQTLAKRRAIEFIGCRQDLLMPEALDAYQAILPDLHYQLLEHCVHFPWEEQAQAFYTALNQALSRPAPEDDFSDLSEADRAWLMDDSGLDDLLQALDATETKARFIEPFDLTEHYHMTNQIRLNQQSLDNGWAELIQCHYNLDQVAQLQIVYQADNTRQLDILSLKNIDLAWVEDASVQINGISKGGQICIYTETRALIEHENGYLIERGPFMRRFLDGYYPLHIELQIEWPGLNLSPIKFDPKPQPGVEIKQTQDSLTLRYWFRGQLKPRVWFKLE